MTGIRDEVGSDTNEWQRKGEQDGRRRDTGGAVKVAVAVAAAVAGKRRDECVQKGGGGGRSGWWKRQRALREEEGTPQALTQEERGGLLPCRCPVPGAGYAGSATKNHGRVPAAMCALVGGS